MAASVKNGVRYRQVASFNRYDQDAVGPRTSIDLIAPGFDVRSTLLNNTLTDPVPQVPNDTTDDGTSLAAPHVTATVAPLQQYGDERILNSGNPSQWNPNGNARRHEVMKAVLMNSADKKVGVLGSTRTVLDSNGKDWFDASNPAATSSSIPLHEEFGAGHLNAKRALQQFSPGEFDPGSANIPAIGWDFETTDGVNTETRYAISTPLQAND